MAEKPNDLRIPFAEWLYRMSLADVPYQARALAVYAVAFKVTSNEELARLVGMDTKGIADKTYNKWKRYLSDHGWVIVRQVTVGRVTTVEVDPALNETPVTFTDLKSRDARKFYGSSNVTITDMVAVEVATELEKVTAELEKTTAQSVEVTADQQKSPHTPLKENNNIKQQPTTTVEQEAARGGGDYLDHLNGTAVDLVAFIGKHAMVEEAEARRMLANNVKTFTSDAMMEAYSVTIAEMAGGLIARPYKYLIETARRIKDGRAKRAAPAAAPGESRDEKRSAAVKEAMAKAEAARGVRRHG